MYSAISCIDVNGVVAVDPVAAGVGAGADDGAVGAVGTEDVDEPAADGVGVSSWSHVMAVLLFGSDIII